MRPVAGRRARAALTAVCAFVGVVGIWNAARYPPGLGYDYSDHASYADNLISHGVLPRGFTTIISVRKMNAVTRA